MSVKKYTISAYTRALRFCLVAILLGSAIFSLFPVHILQAAAITVTNTNDSGPGSLRQAIADAAANDTIIFDSSLNGETITLTSGQIVIEKDVNINGPGADNLIISGNNAYRIFRVGSGFTVTISGLTIANGYVRDYGGGVYNEGQLTLEDSIVTDNVTDDLFLAIRSAGGGIYNSGTLLIRRSTISNNTDDGISYGGGGIFNEGQLTLEDTLVAGNTVHSNTFIGFYGGGGISNSGTLDIFSSTIRGNTAVGYSYGGGGGIYNDGLLTIANSTISDNLADSTFGGGIMNWSEGILSMEQCTVTGNRTNNGGGGIENIGTFTMIDSTIHNNTAYGSLYGGGGIDNTVGTLTVENSTISNNSAEINGGGILIDEGNVSLTYTTISNNQASGGGGIYVTGEITTTLVGLTNTIIANSAAGGDCLPDIDVITSNNTLIEDNSCNPNFSGDPLLGPLQDNGGPTETHALQSGSPAIDQGVCTDAATDQRGYHRPVDFPGYPNSDTGCDIGAYEAQTGEVDDLPTVTITNPVEDEIVAGSVGITAVANDDHGVTQVEFFIAGVSLTVDSDSSDGWETVWDTTGVENGAHTIEAEATDSIGQTSPLASISVTVDNPVPDDPPTVEITDPIDGSTVSGTISIIAAASDDNGVTQVEFFIDGVSLSVDTDDSDGWEATWDTTGATNGVHTIEAQATDTIGQTSPLDSVNVTVDNPMPDDPPTVEITSPVEDEVVAGSVTVTAVANDDHGVTQVEFFIDGVSLSIDNDGSNGWEAVWDTTGVNNGSHTIEAEATDSIGQTSPLDSISVTVDNPVPDDPPTVEITDPIDGSTVSGTISIIAAASDDNGVTQVEFYVNGVSLSVDNDGTNGWGVTWDTTEVDNGSYTLEAEATDTIGQTSPLANVNITVDNPVPDDPPTVTITDPTDGSTVSGTVNISAAASDDNGVTQVEFFLDGVSLAVDSDDSDGWEVVWDTTGIENGDYTIEAQATDTIGQTSLLDSVNVTVDNPVPDDPPTVEITDPIDGSTVSGTISITASATDDHGVTQVEFFIDGVTLSIDSDGSDGWETTWDTTGTINGIHTIEAEATDTSGQTSSLVSVNVDVDNVTVPSTMHVADLDGTSSSSFGRTWRAQVLISVLDENQNPVANATVTGTWSTGIGGTNSCTTDQNGQCTTTRNIIPSWRTEIIFTVNNITHSELSYQPADNDDPDGDSDGTSITIGKP